jgi:hypothetical protein
VQDLALVLLRFSSATCRRATTDTDHERQLLLNARSLRCSGSLSVGAATVCDLPDRRVRTKGVMVREQAGTTGTVDSLYEVLQVSPKALPEVIQAAYRVLARTYHPDVSQAADAEEKTRRLIAAHHVLSNPQRRALYDASLADAARAGAERAREASTRRPPRPTADSRSVVEDRPQAAVVLAWTATACLAIVIVLAILTMLWSLYDSFDTPGSPTFTTRSSRDGSQTVPWTSPPSSGAGGQTRQPLSSCGSFQATSRPPC